MAEKKKIINLQTGQHHHYQHFQYQPFNYSVVLHS